MGVRCLALAKQCTPDFAKHDQKMNLPLIWSCRDDPPSLVAKRVDVIWPKLEDCTFPDGWPKLGWFSMSNASTRRLKLRPSRILVSFSPYMSRSA
jgi:hypothetical protein